jgi:2,4-dienoyl-CoA reductase-like NADH-dependent reductase (Old Yellow Enzyme family)
MLQDILRPITINGLQVKNRIARKPRHELRPRRDYRRPDRLS